MAKTRRKKLPKTLTTEERLALLAAPNAKCPTGLRNLCMLHLMANCGLRVAEVIGLKVHQIDWQSGRIMVHGKGAKDRVVWMNEGTLELIRSWREKRPHPSGELFTTMKGDPVSDRYVRYMVKRMGTRAGIEKGDDGVHPHMLRHTAATDLYRETKNIRLVQKFLGHADLSTTMVYTEIVDDELEDALRNFRRNEAV